MGTPSWGDISNVLGTFRPTNQRRSSRPPTCQQAGALHQQLEGKLVRKRVAGSSPKDVHALHRRCEGWLAPGTRPPKTAGGAARGEAVMAPAPPPRSPSISIPPPGRRRLRKP